MVFDCFSSDITPQEVHIEFHSWVRLIWLVKRCKLPIIQCTSWLSNIRLIPPQLTHMAEHKSRETLINSLRVTWNIYTVTFHRKLTLTVINVALDKQMPTETNWNEKNKLVGIMQFIIRHRVGNTNRFHNYYSLCKDDTSVGVKNCITHGNWNAWAACLDSHATISVLSLEQLQFN